MPNPGKLDPSLSRNQLDWESDDEYVNRMCRLDDMEASLARISTPIRKFCPACGDATDNPDCHICAAASLSGVAK